jgi:hypothetical protein
VLIWDGQGKLPGSEPRNALGGSLIVFLTIGILVIFAIVFGLLLHGAIFISKMMPVREPYRRPAKLRLRRNGREFYGQTEVEAGVNESTAD